MPKSIRATRPAALAALVLSAACTDRLPTEIAPPLDGERVRTEIACTVTMADARMRCDAPASAGGASASVLLGGQGTYVRLESANLAYDADTDVFSMDVLVQNLLSHQMGTPDGVTVTGVKVFFEQMPTATEGNGDITILNQDGEGSFTQVMQPYFEYPQILEPRGLSAPRPWRFGVPGTVQRFGFKVYVSTELPAEQGVLRWLREEGDATPSAFNTMWAASPRAVFAGGPQGSILFYDGTRWSQMITGVRRGLIGLWGTSSRNVFAVGDSGTIIRYDGNRWTRLAGGVNTRRLRSVWTNGATTWVVGNQRNPSAPRDEGLILVSADSGATWTEEVQQAAGNRVLDDVFASPDGQTVFVVGYETSVATSRTEGIVRRSVDGGGTWTETRMPSDSNRVLSDVWTDGQTVVVAGYDRSTQTFEFTGFLLRSTDGGATWTRTDVSGRPANAVLGFSSTQLFAAVNGGVLSFDGTEWTEVASYEDGFYSLAGASADSVFAGGLRGSTAVKRGSAWNVNPSPADVRDVRYGSAWGFASGEMVVLAEAFDTRTTFNWQAFIRRRTAAGWEEFHPLLPVGTLLHGVWGSGPDDVLAVGDSVHKAGLLLRWNGTSWTRTSFAGATLTGIWGDGAGTVYASGNAVGTATTTGVLLRSTDGGQSWTEVDRVVDQQFIGVWGDADGRVFVAANYVAQPDDPRPVVRTLRGAERGYWIDSDTQGRLAGVRTGTGGEVFAYGMRNGRALVVTSLDGGQSFTSATFASPVEGDAFTLRSLWAGNGVAYAVGAQGPILHYANGVWRETRAMVRGRELSGVWGRSATDVYAFGDDSMVLHGTR